MNFLAHAFLSFKHPQILVGNMISDFVKGRKKYDYPWLVLAGIDLHRDIDNFTDAHEATKQAKAILKPAAGPYAGAFADVVYDYFLANDTSVFSGDALQQTAQHTYSILSQYKLPLPPSFSLMLPYMIRHNWLYNYSTVAGIQKSFNGVASRAKYLNDSLPAFQLFLQQQDALQNCYNSFFPHVKMFAAERVQSILDTSAPIFVLNQKAV